MEVLTDNDFEVIWVDDDKVMWRKLWKSGRVFFHVKHNGKWQWEEKTSKLDILALEAVTEFE